MKRIIVSYTFAFVALMFMQARGAYLVTASRDYVDKQVAAVKTNIIISVEAATNDMWHAISDKAEKEISYSKTVFTPPQLSTNDVWLMSADYLEPGDEIVMRYGSRGSFGDNGDCDRWVGDDTLRTALAFDYNDSVWIVTNVNSIAQQGGIALETNLVFSLIGTDSVMLAFSRQTESITNGTYSVVYEDELEDIISSVEPKNYEAVSSAALSAIQSVSVNGETLATNDNRSVNVVVPIPATLDLPIISGDANVGESDKFAREDHVHPAETKVLAYAIPDAYFPMSYTSNETNYTVSCNDELRFDVESVYIYIYNVDKSLCIAKFNKTAPYAYGALGSLLVSNLKFNMNGTPTDPEMDSWPTLRDDAAYVRDVQVAKESDVVAGLALKANTSHASTHATGGTDAITPADIGAQPAGSYKTTQSAVSDPSASGDAYQFIAAISQDTNGVVSATKKTVQSASTSQSGIVQLNDSYTSTSTILAPTAKALKDLYTYSTNSLSGKLGNSGYQKIAFPSSGDSYSIEFGCEAGGSFIDLYNRDVDGSVRLGYEGIIFNDYHIEWPLSGGTFALTNNVLGNTGYQKLSGTLDIVGNDSGGTHGLRIIEGSSFGSRIDAEYGSESISVYDNGNFSRMFNFQGDNRIATLSDIPTNMAWSAITSKPTTLLGYGITDALKADTMTLTNNAAFVASVAAVSPPADTSDCIKYVDDGDEVPEDGVFIAYSHNYAYVTNVTGYVTNVVAGVTNIVEEFSVSTNEYHVVSLYKDGTKVWTSDPSDSSNYGWLIALILALVGGTGTVLWKYFWSADTIVLTVVAATRDGATVTGQTFTVYMGEDTTGRVVAENVEYKGEPVAIEFPRHAKYFVKISDRFSSVPLFSQLESYSRGDRVRYNGETYRFVSNHVANTAWNADEVEDTGVSFLYDHFAPNTASGTANMDTVVTLTYMDAGINPDYVAGTSPESVPKRNIHSLTEFKTASDAVKSQYETDAEKIAAGLELFVGVELPDTWVSDDTTPVTRQDPKIVADYGYCTDKSGNQIIGAVIMCKWATQRDVQFDPRNQEVAAESTAQTWDDNGTTKPVYYYGWAPPYNSASAYTKDTTFCTYDNRLWKCSTAIAAGGEEWNPAHWTAQGYINNSVTTTSSSILPFDPTADYVAGSFCYYTDAERGFTGIYKCTNAVSAGQWNAADWTLTVFDILEASLTKLSLSTGDSLPTGYAAIFRTSLNASGSYVQNAIRCGHNNYGTSAQRQYFNDESNEPVKWWKQQHPGQIAPFNPGTSTVKGWLSGCSEELRGLITEVKVPCYSNSNTDSAQGAYTTTDKVFMLSGTQFCGNVNANEGHILPYLSRYLIECIEDGDPGANNGHTVVRLATWSDRPVTGTSGVTYLAKDTGFIYAWRDDTNAYTGVLNNDDGGWYRDHRTKTIQHYDVKENPAEGQTAFPAIADASTSVAYYDDSTNKVWRKNNNAWQDISDQYYIYLATGGLYNNYRRRYRITSHGSAVAVRLRSAYRGYSHDVWIVNTYGRITNNAALIAHASVPACVIK